MEFYSREQAYQDTIQQCKDEIEDLKKRSMQLQTPFQFHSQSILQESHRLPSDLQANLEKAEYLYKLLRSCRDVS